MSQRDSTVSPQKLHVSAFLQEIEVTYEIEILRSHLELGEANDLRQIALPIAPVQRRNRRAPERCGRPVLALLAGQIVQCDRAHALAPYHDLFRFEPARRR